MLWDVFCRVIDNFGDIGVCWRLARDLGQRGHAVRLWIDDPGALAWMAPEVHWAPCEASEANAPYLQGLNGLSLGRGQAGVTVLRWSEAEQHLSMNAGLQAGDVVIEAFGCNPPDTFVARMHRPTPPAWVNLEYLSAEAYVERCHGLPSPVGSGPGKGLVKRFFYPGFTQATGGLLREPGVLDAALEATSHRAQRTDWLRALGLNVPADAPLVCVFCYASAPVGALLTHLQSIGKSRDSDQHPIQVLLTPGHAQHLAEQWLAQQGCAPEGVRLHALPALPQPAFDRLLWTCDLNLVRGEDSAVRALWAGKPHVWQIYEQDDGVHADKLNAFMDRWMVDWPAPLRESVIAWWRGWNGLAPLPESLPEWRGEASPWALSSQASRSKLTLQADLASQLIQFVTTSG